MKNRTCGKAEIIKLPWPGRLILKNLLPGYDYEYVIGAYEQGYQDRKKSGNSFRAILWFWWQVCLSAPPLIRQKTTGGISMLISYFKTAGRNFYKNKIFSVINILGLAIGMACCFLMLLWVQDEMSYDKFHKNGKNIYRITTTIRTQDKVTATVGSPAPLGQALVQELPEVINACRVQSGWGGWRLQYKEKFFYKEKLAAVDPTFFEIFSFEFTRGNAATALPDKNSVVITQDLAKKCFADADPMGEFLKMGSHNLKVTGVIRNIPKNSHLRFDYAFSAENMREWREAQLDSWDYLQFATYIQVDPMASKDSLVEKINGRIKKTSFKYKAEFGLQPLNHIHLRSAPYNSWMVVYEQTGNINMVYIFSLVAFAILLLACINFMNLATARSARRGREVGIRKVVGANKRNIFGQYMGESMLLTFIALAVAVFLLNLVIPYFNSLSGKTLSLDQAGVMALAVGLLAGAIFTGLFSGSYPAVCMARSGPLKILGKAGSGGRSRGSRLRRILVILQFTVTIGLIITSTVIYRQMDYVKNKNLGYTQDHVLVMGNFIRGNKFKEKLSGYPGIVNISYSHAPRQTLYGSIGFQWPGKDPNDKIMLYPIMVDYNYLDLFKMEMAQGRFFSHKFSTDATQAAVVNESAAKVMGLAEPLGKQLVYTGYQGRTAKIIGVIKDFHNSSLHNAIEPMVFLYTSDCHQVCVRISPANVDQTLGYIKTTWDSLTNRPFEYQFLDSTINNFYKNEQKTANLVLYATVLAMFIALMGLFGLSAHTAEQRTKEIGIRKVMGASISRIMGMLLRDITRWFFVANLIAWPIAYIVAKKWIQNFAYHPGISLWIFIFSAAAALIIAVLTIMYQVMAAARKNPVHSLRYE